MEHSLKYLTAMAAAAVMVSAAGVDAQLPENSPILSEFLCNQTGMLETEWIELYNPSLVTVDLRRYKIGDALALRAISDTSMPLGPGEYIILADDPERFLQFYTDFAGRVTSPRSWQVLNNDGGETLRLAYENGTVIDSFYYDHGFPDNRSWERYIDPDGETHWGGSYSPSGSTPGIANAYTGARTATIDLTVSPDPFSPDGDGFEDVTTISINLPEAETFDLAVYDLSGRKVKTMCESALAIPREIVWDGRGDDGRPLPVGIYVIYARVEGGVSMETKKTVVIAR